MEQRLKGGPENYATVAENDIYRNQERYDRFLTTLPDRALPEEQWQRTRKHKYRIRNPANVRHFQRLIPVFEARDLSYIHRIRQLQHLLLAAHLCEKDFAECTREDMNSIMAGMHARLGSAKSKHDFIVYIRGMWRLLFPEKDERGQPDDTIFPYVVRHLSSKIDKSKQRLRNDRFTPEEFEALLNFFGDDPRLQAYLMLAMESLGRPQELLTRKLKHVELHDLFAKVWLTEHGKEGPGLLQCIDAYPYLVRWLEEHPLKHDPEAYLFVNLQNHVGRPLTPFNINKHIRNACHHLGMRKNITCYSLKRNGVTFRRLRGESDFEIQHAARWTSARQVKTYDLSVQEDAFKRQLEKRGILAAEAKQLQPSTKRCAFCQAVCGFTARTCGNCLRPLDRKSILEEVQRQGQLERALEVLNIISPVLEKHPELLAVFEKKVEEHARQAS